MQIENFDHSEFACRCGCGTNSVSPDTLYKIEAARIDSDIPYIITSATRCEEYNEFVGGVDDSAHLILFDYSFALDIACDESCKRYIIVNSLLRAGFNRIGIADTFIHVDDSPVKQANVIWTY